MSLTTTIDWRPLIQDGILVLEDRGDEWRILEANASAARYLALGAEAPSLIGESLRKLVDATLQSELADAMAAARKEPTLRFSILHWERDRFLDMEVRSLVQEEPALRGFFVQIRDVTEQYQAEQYAHRRSVIMGLLQSVAMSANFASSWNTVLPSAVRNVCSCSEWDFGHIYVPARANPGEMKTTNIWYAKSGENGRPTPAQLESLLKCSLGLELPNRVIRARQPIWITELSKDAGFAASRIPNELGLGSAFAFPVRLGEEFVAILEFFAFRAIPPDDLLIDATGNLGDQLARVLERERTLALLKDQQMMLASSSRLSALGEMAGGIAHEINNPLAAIHATAEQLRELAEEGSLEPSVAVTLTQRIERTSMRIGKIVRGLRTFAREGQEDPVEPASMRTIIDDTLVFCAEKLKVAGIELTVKDDSQGVQALCRSVQVGQVLLNLISNAQDALAEKGTAAPLWIRIEVSADGPWVEVGVTDSGSGIPYKVQEKMFQPFYTTKPVGKGTGLGLSISRSMLEAQGGTLIYDHSAPNTRFIIRLPRAGA